MSDFILTQSRLQSGQLATALKSIYHSGSPDVMEFHGEWGSLAVTRSHYSGFEPVEDDDQIIVVVGGPVLMWNDNGHINERGTGNGTRALHARWQSGLDWSRDLSGPYAVLRVNKHSGNFTLVTDMMSFIPVFSATVEGAVYIGTHVDAVATAAGVRDKPDLVSWLDFVLHGYVTYPHTVYDGIVQLAPASIHHWRAGGVNVQEASYWKPVESYAYETVQDAAVELREALRGYVERLTSTCERVALFLSGGEDSRTILALLPRDIQRDAFIFLDQMNREGRIARAIAEAYGANFTWVPRRKLRYLEVMEECADLVGGGAEYLHAHSYGLHEICGLDNYNVVFGGLFADALLKGSRIRVRPLSGRLPGYPKVRDRAFSVVHSSLNPHIATHDALEALIERRKGHYKKIFKMRPESAEEWFELWPSSMNRNMPNLHANRRLFASHEPFMASDVCKISAAVPQTWKLNRVLFHRMAKPLLKHCKWVPHGNGSFPYYSWLPNSFIGPPFRVWWKVSKRLGLMSGNQGPWFDWNLLMKSAKWEQMIDQAVSQRSPIETVLTRDVRALLSDGTLSLTQRVNLVQAIYSIGH